MIIGNDHRTDVVFKLTVTLVCCSEICRLDLHGSEEMQSGNVSPTLANVDADRRAPQELIRDRIIPGSPEDALESIFGAFLTECLAQGRNTRTELNDRTPGFLRVKPRSR